MDFASLPPDYFISSLQFMKKVHTQLYPTIDPTSPALSQAGKVVIITGASKGLGRSVSLSSPADHPKAMTTLLALFRPFTMPSTSQPIYCLSLLQAPPHKPYLVP
jgi:hypothetical protein